MKTLSEFLTFRLELTVLKQASKAPDCLGTSGSASANADEDGDFFISTSAHLEDVLKLNDVSAAFHMKFIARHTWLALIDICDQCKVLMKFTTRQHLAPVTSL